MVNTPSDFSFALWGWQTLALIILALWIYCLIDVLRHKFKNDAKTTWFLIVFFLPFLGTLLYIFTGRNRKIITN
tara:strand:- start:886 stop:1107 length:222 start_codon:yes stop_codon:yes gene_type:complete